jgi:hypothetical protein
VCVVCTDGCVYRCVCLSAVGVGVFVFCVVRLFKTYAMHTKVLQT